MVFGKTLKCNNGLITDILTLFLGIMNLKKLVLVFYPHVLEIPELKDNIFNKPGAKTNSRMIGEEVQFGIGIVLIQ